jgi:hypothetical protein
MYNFFKSRKFWLAVLGVAQTLVLHYLDVPKEVWGAINALLITVITGIAIEDAGAKAGSVEVVPYIPEE